MGDDFRDDYRDGHADGYDEGYEEGLAEGEDVGFRLGEEDIIKDIKKVISRYEQDRSGWSADDLCRVFTDLIKGGEADETKSEVV
tara:strand:+ start:1741 stop:1995 length:255 start_codon:yes stop_codon:yes gene_type:complete